MERTGDQAAFSACESQEYTPPNNTIYRNYLKERPQTHGLYRGLTAALIGVTVGLTAFLLRLLIDLIAKQKSSLARKHASDADPWNGLLVTTAFAAPFVLFASVLATYFRPAASGSGVPELIGFLNGTAVRNMFDVGTLVTKFLSCVTTVGSGLPVGEEGPMISIGASLGANVSQYKSRALRIDLRCLRHFRNARERRNFVNAGAAAGVSAAFHAPIGGLLFVMEEVSTFWRLTLTWQTFFCCILATFTTSLFASAFSYLRVSFP